ncbi:MAG: hypothetical protein AAF587_04170 [Bacteroidota bacterium]
MARTLPRTLSLALLLAGVFLSLIPASYGQVSVGIEVQIYPTGIMPGVRGEVMLSEQNELHLRAGANLFDHRDLGVQEEEIGGGGGFTLGYRRYFGENQKGFFLGVRNDFWFNANNWRNNIGTIQETSGTTNIVVVQPTAEAGYRLPLGNSLWTLAPAIGFGYEVNVISNGADVGQGPILLIGASLMKRMGE